MNVRRRFPIFDTIFDGCRMLPETIQMILFVLFFGGISAFVMLGLQNIVLTFIVVEVLLILVLIQKNFVYRRISKIRNAIRYQILWIKTKQDSSKILRYFIFSSILFLVGLWAYNKIGNGQYFLAVSLLSILYFLKGLFYVPLVHIRILEDEEEIQFINDFNGKCLEFKLYEIEKIEIQEKRISIFSESQKVAFKIFFNKKEERIRLREFLEWYLPKTEIL